MSREMHHDGSVEVGRHVTPELLQAAVEALDCSVDIWTAADGLVYVNAVGRAFLGFDPVGQAHEKTVARAGMVLLDEAGAELTPEDRPHRRALDRGEAVTGQVVQIRMGDRCRWVSVGATPLVHAGEATPFAAVVTYRDITRQRAGRAALAESERSFRLLAENARDVIARYTVDGVCTYVSPASEELLGRSPQSLLGKWSDVTPIHPDDRHVLFGALEALAKGQDELVRYRVQHVDGRWLWVETVGRGVLDETGQLVEIQSATRDITARLEQEQRLSRMALTDGLTGLPNRAALVQYLQVQLLDRRSVALLFLDLDRFKVVNDSLGHGAGDHLLRVVAGRLSGAVRDGDLVSRLGGDEFVLAAPGLDEQAALGLAEEVQRVLAAPISVDGHELVVSTSLGIVVSDPDLGEQSPEDLLRDADVSMYRAKERGRARAVVWTEELGAHAVRRLGLESELRAALERRELVVHYQPQVELATGQIPGLEALVRWEHPQRGLLGPGEFLDTADQSGLIVELGRQVLALALEQLVAWRALPGYGELTMSVNVSAQELLHPGHLDHMLDLLERHALPPQALTVEVLESVLFDAEGAVHEALMGLARAGVQLALDDFGTGSSSLIHLREVPFTMLKVDRSFVSGLGSSARDEAIVRAMRSLTADLGLGCIAEGVEVDFQRQWLIEQNIQLAQGFLLHRPLAVPALTALLSAAAG